MKIIIISGHGAGDTGAVGNGYKEATLTREAASILDGKLESYDVKVVRYPTDRNAYEDNRSGALRVSFSSYDLVIEIHFNSFNASAHGTEVLYRSLDVRKLADKVSDAIASVGFTNRGAKMRGDLMNMNSCYRADVPYILIETCFIDNANDIRLYRHNIDRVWTDVAEAIAKYYGLKKLASAGKPVETNKTSPSKKKPVKSTKNGYSGAFPSLPKKGYLAKGDTGAQVKRLQRFLNWFGNYGLDVDGSFGALTKKAVEKFQKAAAIKVDGSFGAESLRAAKAAKK